MEIVVGLLIAGMIVFAIWSGFREIQLYRRYLRGETQYLVSRRRRNRRVLIALVLLVESAFLFYGIYILKFTDPLQALLFWIPPLILIIALVYLGMRDFQETSRDIDVIYREASDVIVKKIKERSS
jgi:hypothetical protein